MSGRRPAKREEHRVRALRAAPGRKDGASPLFLVITAGNSQPCPVFSLLTGREAHRATPQHTRSGCSELPAEPGGQGQGTLPMPCRGFGASSLQQGLALLPVASAPVFTSNFPGPSKSNLVSTPCSSGDDHWPSPPLFMQPQPLPKGAQTSPIIHPLPRNCGAETRSDLGVSSQHGCVGTEQ